jgi:hypothetical protein
MNDRFTHELNRLLVKLTAILLIVSAVILSPIIAAGLDLFI